MWARDTGGGSLVVDTFCRDCHDDGPYPGDHPVNVVAWSQEVRQALRSNAVAMPVYDANGRMATLGMIGCPTCHNPHQHAPEGWDEDVPPKYLRAANPQGILCADCHASQALFRYKFYHSRKSRGR